MFYKQHDINNIARNRSEECARHKEVRWTCTCGNEVITLNNATSVQCGQCDKYMQWSYPTEAI